MQLSIVLLFSISLVSAVAVPQGADAATGTATDASEVSYNSEHDPICHRNSDCGTGCCYNGICLAYCFHEQGPIEDQKCHGTKAKCSHHPGAVRDTVPESRFP
ncbi:hypothetical protein BO70DRAFT_349134 [Aspergillus heteromorphus CBS 117.55]|uniref:Uncharacterized protein n=1 Tax=Aspergillus heteromorphus CBS 117.55 TaxID=1448321 RepID=A0A317X2N6_9EURO|nr:uncharacterized protein BO70DRAFT_349134 [Aspergillus heteromorphus CBS 117.55]PWY92826.1 hypothetical protein BO70DRAFT_349134 [Aspergillus heteromorphus CBS 117.55]